eukprot:gene50-141_t
MSLYVKLLGVSFLSPQVKSILVESEESRNDQGVEGSSSVEKEERSCEEKWEQLTETTAEPMVRPLPSGRVWGKPDTYSDDAMSDIACSDDAKNLHTDGITSERSSVGGHTYAADSSIAFGESSQFGGGESSSENATQEGISELLLACKTGDRGVVKKILENPKVDVNKIGATGSTGTSKIISGGVTYGGFTPLGLACFCGNLSVVQELLTCGNIDVNRTGYGGDDYSPLMRACMKGNARIVKCLVAHPDIDVNFYCDGLGGCTALYLAINNGHYHNSTIVEHLLAHPQIDVNKAGVPNGFTPLMKATVERFSTVVEHLLAHPQIDVHAKNKNGQTALSIASSLGYSSIIQLIENHYSYKDQKIIEVYPSHVLSMLLRESNVESWE